MKRQFVHEVRRNLRWLADRQDEDGFKKYLAALELEEGSPQFEEALSAFREYVQSRQSRSGRA
ncbi:MAG: hypothetical protein HY510_06975 [Acidobacteria bacterium]|nr:hypothetical protein [Acidobacteriota bacterium]